MKKLGYLLLTLVFISGLATLIHWTIPQAQAVSLDVDPLPLEWDIKAIRDVSTLATESLNGEGVSMPVYDEEGNLLETYRLYVVSFNGQPTNNLANPYGYERVYAIVAAPDDGEVTEWHPATLLLHAYPAAAESGPDFIEQVLPDTLQDFAQTSPGWLVIPFAPGAGFVRQLPCSSYKDLSDYGSYVSADLFDALGLPASTCDLVTDLSHEEPCLESFFTPADDDENPDFSYYFTTYAYNAMRSLTLMEVIPFVAQDKIMVEGWSAGGLATYLLNAVDDRPAAAIVVVATGDLNQNLTLPNSLLADALYYAAGLLPTDPDIQAAIAKLDPLYYAPHQQAPTLMLLSGSDPIFALSTGALTFEAIPGSDKRLHVSPTGVHTYSAERLLEQRQVWYEKHIAGSIADPLPPNPRHEKHYVLFNSLIYIDPATVEGEPLMVGFGSLNGTRWGQGSSLWYASASINKVQTNPSFPVNGKQNWRYGNLPIFNWAHTMSEAQYNVTTDTGELLPFRLSSPMQTDGSTAFSAAFGVCAACLEHPACWTLEQYIGCAGCNLILPP